MFTILRVLIVIVLLFGVHTQAQQRPHVLFISIDDLNDWIGPLGGHPYVKTPHIDALFQRGVSFNSAHCSQPVCTASRNSLLSGLHPTTSGWYYGTSTYAETYPTVMANHPMLPQFFKDNAYTTYQVGKISHSNDNDISLIDDGDLWSVEAPNFWSSTFRNSQARYSKKFLPLPEGLGQLWQYFEDSLGWDPERIDDEVGHALCAGPAPDSLIPNESVMIDAQIADWADSIINLDHTKPFFLAVGFMRPHVPYCVPQKYFDLYDSAELVLPFIPADEMCDIPLFGKAIARSTSSPGGDYEHVSKIANFEQELVHGYLASVSFVDAQVGKVIDALHASGLWDSTVIVLWSDHGQHLGEKRAFRKQALWEEDTRVPLFIKTVNGTNAGTSVDQVVSLLDVYPTLLDLCGFSIPTSLDGRSLDPLISAPSTLTDSMVLTNWYYGNYAVRSNHWRYIQYRDGGQELYDHSVDPGEHHNLANDPQYASIIAQHQQRIPTNPAPPAGELVFTDDRDWLQGQVDIWAGNLAPLPSWLACQQLDTVPVIADAFIHGGSFADDNYGNANNLQVNGSANDATTQKIYLKFNLGGLDTITTAQLYLYGRAAEIMRLHAYSLSSDAWTEEDLTWNQAPAFNSLNGSAVVDTAEQWMVLDVTRLAQQEWASDSLLSLGLTDDGQREIHLSFASKEAGRAVAPYLLVAGAAQVPPEENLAFVYDSLPATHDSYVKRGDDANQNFGAETRLRLKTPSNGNINLERMAVLQFDVSGYRDVTSAKLQLYGEAESTFILDVHPLVSNRWDEATVTWDNVPALAPLIGRFIVQDGHTQWYEVDVTAAFHNHSDTLSFGIRDDQGTGDFADFFSKENLQNSFHPRLLISRTDSNLATSIDLFPSIGQQGGTFLLGPNPSQGDLIFHYFTPHSAFRQYHFELLDLQGRVVYTGSDRTNNPYFAQSLDLHNLENGIYFFRLWVDKEVFVQKVRLQR